MKLIEIGSVIIIVMCTVVIVHRLRSIDKRLRKVESILHDQGMAAAERVVADATRKRHLRVVGEEG